MVLNGVDADDEFSRYHHQRPRSVKIDPNPKGGVRLNRYSNSYLHSCYFVRRFFISLLIIT
jgi:hypothetical protein